MEGELETIAEPETPTIGEVEEQPVDLNTIANEGDTEIEEQPEPVDDDEEFEWEGKKIKGPKGLKDAVLRQADYTKKTQEVAEQRRALEAYQERLVQQAQVSETELNARAALVNIESRLQQYEKTDWDAWDETDPVAASRGWREYQTLDKQRTQYVDALQQTATLRTQAAQQDFAKRVEETEAFARKSIPNWTPEVDKTVLDYARQKAIPDEFLKQHMQPVLYEILYKASIGERVMAKQASPPRPAATPAAQPLQTVSAKSNAPVRKTLSDMSMDEYVAARKAGRG